MRGCGTVSSEEANAYPLKAIAKGRSNVIAKIESPTTNNAKVGQLGIAGRNESSDCLFKSIRNQLKCNFAMISLICVDLITML